MDIKRLHVGKTLSDTAVDNGTIYLAGQVADDTTHNIDGQTREVLGHIDRLLAEVGSDKTRILMCQIYLADIERFPFDEHGMGRMGGVRPRAAARDGGSEVGQAGMAGRNGGDGSGK